MGDHIPQALLDTMIFFMNEIYMYSILFCAVAKSTTTFALVL